MNSNDTHAARGSARRDFLKLSGAAAVGLALSRFPVMAGPFTRADFEKWVPADKKLSPGWVKSLFARGTPEVLRGGDLKYVGMPVGGIGAGQLYLGGDGKLWHWDIFNRHLSTGADHYAKPPLPTSPLAQQFSLRIGDRIHPLDREGFADVSFRGEYPIGIVEYADPAVPLRVRLEAFSPFIPLDTDDSSLPATILEFTVHNPGARRVEATLLGELENGVCLHSRSREGTLRQRIRRTPGLTVIEFSAEAPAEPTSPRPDVVLEDWDKWNYGGWKVEGAAFGERPVRKKDIPPYQGDVGGDTASVVNSHASAPGQSIAEKDNATGQLTSQNFVIERHFLTCWIGGGRVRPGSPFGLTLVVDGKPVKTVAGQNKNAMELECLDVRAFAGRPARLELVDNAGGSWGNIGLGKITLTDNPPDSAAIAEAPDYGTMALALLGAPADEAGPDAAFPFTAKPVGHLGRRLRLAPGESARVTFLLAWHFPNLSLSGPMRQHGRLGRHYATRFPSAYSVVEYIAGHFPRLAQATRRWRDTWYDSTLPFWLLDRTLLNASILATSTCFRFADGRFYGWEGVGCCAGTCGHVYHYAQAAARLFPDLERTTRERVDFGLALQPDGAIHFRGECNRLPAIDGQAGTILRALREHQVSADDAFLRRNWPQIRRATQWLIAQDGNQDGLIEGKQHNTLDADWYGAVAWLSGLYLAALLAAARMADVVGDATFAAECRDICARGRPKLVAELFDGEYFINRVDANRAETINSGTGCHIDQVLAQSWAFQVGLPRVLPKPETESALRSLWRYNFSPDVGPYRALMPAGRWYAMPGEAGLLMCSFPRTDWDYQRAAGKGRETFAGYFNECMNGFEYQVAGHMIREGLVLEGLAVTRAVHDRYHASRRNPWNEVECGDHYVRSMASYGVYLPACGFEYDGPAGHLGFAPRLTPAAFKCAFTGAEGWGSFSQKQEDGRRTAEIALHWGRLKLSTIALEGGPLTAVKVSRHSAALPARLSQADGRILISLEPAVEIAAGETLQILLT